jgi:tetratricopeptide (TPR) repeat protein
MEALAKAMAGSNGHPLVWHARGNALFGADRIEEAAAAYEKALASMPDFIEAQVNCGVCWHRLGEPAKALRYLDAALARRRTTLKRCTTERLRSLICGAWTMRWRVRPRRARASRTTPTSSGTMLLPT